MAWILQGVPSRFWPIFDVITSQRLSVVSGHVENLPSWSTGDMVLKEVLEVHSTYMRPVWDAKPFQLCSHTITPEPALIHARPTEFLFRSVAVVAHPPPHKVRCVARDPRCFSVVKSDSLSLAFLSVLMLCVNRVLCLHDLQHCAIATTRSLQLYLGVCAGVPNKVNDECFYHTETTLPAMSSLFISDSFYIHSSISFQSSGRGYFFPRHILY